MPTVPQALQWVLCVISFHSHANEEIETPMG
jgi:hypothetical protein